MKSHHVTNTEVVIQESCCNPSYTGESILQLIAQAFNGDSLIKMKTNLILKNFFKSSSLCQLPNLSDIIQFYIQQLDQEDNNFYFLFSSLQNILSPPAVDITENSFIDLLIHVIPHINVEKYNEKIFSLVVNVFCRLIEYNRNFIDELQSNVDFSIIFPILIKFDNENYTQTALLLSKTITENTIPLEESIHDLIFQIIHTQISNPSNPATIISSLETFCALLSYETSIDYSPFLNEIFEFFNYPNSNIKLLVLKIIQEASKNYDIKILIFIENLLEQFPENEESVQVAELDTINILLQLNRITPSNLYQTKFLNIFISSFENASFQIKTSLIQVFSFLLDFINLELAAMMLQTNVFHSIIDLCLEDYSQFDLPKLIYVFYNQTLKSEHYQAFLDDIKEYTDSSEFIEVLLQNNIYHEIFSSLL